MQPDRTVPPLNLHDTPLLVDVGSNDFVSAGLADEWLQARNALSIEIFLQDTLFRRSPRHLRLKASPTASSGEPEPSSASLRRPSLRECGATIVSNHQCGGRARRPGSPRDPLIDPLRQRSLPRLPKGREGVSPKKFRYSARALPAATRRQDRCERTGDLLQLNLRCTSFQGIEEYTVIGPKRYHITGGEKVRRIGRELRIRGGAACVR